MLNTASANTTDTPPRAFTVMTASSPLVPSTTPSDTFGSSGNAARSATLGSTTATFASAPGGASTFAFGYRTRNACRSSRRQPFGTTRNATRPSASIALMALASSATGLWTTSSPDPRRTTVITRLRGMPGRVPSTRHRLSSSGSSAPCGRPGHASYAAFALRVDSGCRPATPPSHQSLIRPSSVLLRCVWCRIGESRGPCELHERQTHAGSPVDVGPSREADVGARVDRDGGGGLTGAPHAGTAEGPRP